MQENPNQIHGRLNEALHVAGYTVDRAFAQLEWLLHDGRWRHVGNGYDDVNEFMATVKLPRGADPTKREAIARRLKELQPEVSQRRIAGVLGVSESTVRLDMGTKKQRADISAPTETQAINAAPSEPPPADISAPPTPELTEPKDNHRAIGTGENEWYTPVKYVARARLVMGGIDLDPASSEVAQERIKASRYYTVEDDGLVQPWSGRVWLNPPYAQPAIRHFAEKMVAEVSAGSVTAAIMLTHNYTDTEWFHMAESVAEAVCFTRGRIRFEAPDGTTAAPTQGQAFFYYGSDVHRFREVFDDLGFVR